MFKGLGQSGGKGAMAAGAFAAAVLALGVWIGGKRDLSQGEPGGAVPVSGAQKTTPQGTSENATLDQNAVQGVSVGPEGKAATEPDAEKQANDATQVSEARTEAPAFDEVRRDPDGMTVIAGRAAPGSTVAVLNDGKEIASATADGAGKFATLAIIPPDGAGHVLTLMVQDGSEQVASVEEILLAPVAAPAPIEVAEADTSADPLPIEADKVLEEGGSVPAQSEDDVAVAALTAEEDAGPLPGDSTLAQDEGIKSDTDTAADLSSEPFDSASPVGVAQDSTQSETANGAATDATPLAGTGTAEANATTDESTIETPAASETGSEMAEGDATEDADTPQNGNVVAADTSESASPRDTAERETADPTGEAVNETTLAETSSPEAPAAETSADAETSQDSDSTPNNGSTPSTAREMNLAAGTTTSTAEPENEIATANVTASDPAQPAPAPPSAPAVPTAPVAVLKSTAEGVERIDTAPPQVMTNVALDTIGYSDQGDVQLAGRAQPETREVRVYLNNSAVISLPVDQEGRWRGDLPDVDEGIYTLRVDELSAGGDVTSRVETPFKRESPETLAAASSGLTGPLSAITVQKGDTLWAISRERYGDPLLYVKVFQANSDNIRDPDLIYPGQVFDLPEETQSE